MNKVITINLNGNAYQLEEGGYEILRAYLAGAALKLEGNPDKDEILADIEQAIADKCRGVITAYRTVVSAKEIAAIVGAMGEVDDVSAPAGDPAENPGRAADAARGHPDEKSTGAKDAGAPGPAKRLYLIHDDAMIGGVCTGLAAYFNIDVTLVRLAFVILTLVTGGIVALIYFFMMIIVPSARTAEQKAAAYGAPLTAQEFIRRAKAGYYEGMNAFADEPTRRRWKRQCRHWGRSVQRDMNAHAHQWQRNWSHYWGRHPHPGVALAPAAIALLSLFAVVVTFAWFFALISLVTTGAVFGVLPPAGMPLWVGIVGLVILYNFMMFPVRALRPGPAGHGPRGSGCAPVLFGLWDLAVFIGLVVVLVWLADRYVPHAHDVFMHLPSTLRHGLDAVKDWWAQK
jgi:phage shock protein PspC (stress-responsive transcriptional regulator)